MGSLNRKKQRKRSDLEPYTAMASRPTPSSKYKNFPRIVFVLFVLLAVASLGISLSVWSNVTSYGASFPRIYTIEVVNEFPHDPDAFTQGLLYAGNDTIFESTGLNGKSSVRKVALRSGKVEALQKMDDSYFGEGLTLLGERLFQLTWLKNTGFIYDRNDLSNFKEFTHQMPDGWGLATDGEILFGSDGSSTLYLLDSQTFKAVGKKVVKYNGHEVHNLNELEFINKEVWANVWQTDCIARVSPEDGTVTGWILLQHLRENLQAAGNHAIDVLNGIAWDSDKERVFVTGKLWPKLYEIKLNPAKKQFESGAIEQLCLRRPVYFAKP